MKNTAKIFKNAGIVVGVAIFWIAIWAVSARIVNDSLLLPYPWEVLKALVGVIKSTEFFKIVFGSIGNIFLGFIWGQVMGVVFGVITARFKLVRAVLWPLMSIVKSTPIASFIILVLVWAGKVQTPAIIAFLIVLPAVWENIQTGILKTDKKLLEVTRVYGFGALKKARYLFVPSVLPYYVSAFKLSLGMAWKAGVAAEVLCASSLTLGGKIYDAKIYLEVAELFAWTLVVIIISMLIEFLLVKLLGKLSAKLSISETGKGAAL